MGGRGSGSRMSSGGGGRSDNWSNSDGVRNFLQGELDKYGLGISKNELAERIYRAARDGGGDVAVLNEKYISVQGVNGRAEFSFTKSKAEGRWKLTPMLGYGDVTKGRHNGYTMYRAAGQWFSNKTDAEWAVVADKLGRRR